MELKEIQRWSLKSELVFPLGVVVVWAAVTKGMMKEMLLTTGVYRLTVLEARKSEKYNVVWAGSFSSGWEGSLCLGHSPAILMMAVFMCTWHPP